MSETYCPYCNSAQSLLLGNVYCSHQGKNMEMLETGTLFIKSKKLEETKDHVSRLSIRCMLKGEQHYKVGNHEHKVTPENYLVVNQGQHYRTSFEGNEEQEMILVAFKPGFAEELLHSMITPDDLLLDDPFKEHEQQIYFFEQTYHMDPVIGSLFKWVRSQIDEEIAWRKSIDLDSVYSTLLSRLLQVHRNLYSEINKIGSTKYSTRVELYRRLCIAKDFMDAHLERKVKVDEVSNVACLSPHHFKRTFKKLFGKTPHSYHVQKRLEYSCQLIQQAQLSVSEICQKVGFEDTSSFIRLFRLHYGCTPGIYSSKR